MRRRTERKEREIEGSEVDDEVMKITLEMVRAIALRDIKQRRSDLDR